MDIHLPGMDGVQAMRRIWDEVGRDEVAIAAITASVMEHERQEYLKAGFDAFLGKPFRPEQVYACLGELLAVEFEHESPTAGAGAEAERAALPQIALPEELHARLWEAADLSQVTAFERHLAEAESLGPKGQRLAAQLSALNQQPDYRVK